MLNGFSKHILEKSKKKKTNSLEMEKRKIWNSQESSTEVGKNPIKNGRERHKIRKAALKG